VEPARKAPLGLVEKRRRRGGGAGSRLAARKNEKGEKHFDNQHLVSF